MDSVPTAFTLKLLAQLVGILIWVNELTLQDVILGALRSILGLREGRK